MYLDSFELSSGYGSGWCSFENGDGYGYANGTGDGFTHDFGDRYGNGSNCDYKIFDEHVLILSW